MSCAKRLFDCTSADGVSSRKAWRSADYGSPPFPTGIRATTLNSASLDSSLLLSTPPGEISPSLWTCPICLGIPRVPAQISKCGHIGCMSCLLRHLQVSGVTRNEWEQRTMVCCPYCRVDFAEDNLKIYSTWQPLSKAVIGLVKARCSLGSSSTAVTCSWSGPITNLLHHETYECPARQIVCPNLFCKYTDSESKVKQHFGTCSYLQVRCVECCLPFRWVSRDKHDCKQALKDALRGVSKKLVEAGKSVPTEYSLGEPGDVVVQNDYYSESLNGDDTVLVPSSESSESPGISRAIMTSTPNGAGVVPSTFGAPVRRQRSVASVSRIVNVSSVRPSSPVSGDTRAMNVSDDDYFLLD